MKVDFTVNGSARSVDVDPATPLLWVVRDYLKLKGTKFGCGVGECGACTVHRAGSGNLHSGDKWNFCLTSA